MLLDVTSAVDLVTYRIEKMTTRLLIDLDFSACTKVEPSKAERKKDLAGFNGTCGNLTSGRILPRNDLLSKN